MQITNNSFRPTLAARPATVASQPSAEQAAVPAESFTRASEALPTLYARDEASRKLGSKVALGLTGAIAGGALATWAASSGGVVGGIVGAAALAIPAAAVAGIGTGLAVERFGKNPDASDIVGGGIWGVLGGGAAGIAAGALLGSSGGPIASIGLGVAGAVTGLVLSNFAGE